MRRGQGGDRKAPLSLPQERNPRNIKNQASIRPKSKIINQKKAFPDD